MAAGSAAAESLPSVLTLPCPADDMHLHLRDGAAMLASLSPLVRGGAVSRGIVMPNLQPPVIDARMAADYRERIMQAVRQVQEELRAEGQTVAAELHAFTPLMTLYLTDQTTPATIRDARYGPDGARE